MKTAKSFIDMSVDGSSRNGARVIEGGYTGRLTRSRSGRSVGSKRTARNQDSNVHDIDPML